MEQLQPRPVLGDWLDRQREQGIEALAIPHNMDRSQGAGFPEIGENMAAGNWRCAE